MELEVYFIGNHQDEEGALNKEPITSNSYSNIKNLLADNLTY